MPALAGTGVDVVDVDLDRPGGPVPPEVTAPVLVVARRDGVPVGSALVTGRPSPDGSAVLAALDRRVGDPPGPGHQVLAVTVAVCTRERPELLARCLGSLLESAERASGEVTLDLLVVENGPGDSRTYDVATAAGARYDREPVPGLDVARNRAAAAATGDVLAFVDDDVVVDPLWLRTLGRAFAAHPDVPAVSGQVLALKLDTPARIEFERTTGFSLGWTPLWFHTAEADDLPFRSGIGVGCNMAIRRDALARIGPFDEALDTGRPLPGGGDLDLMIRAVLDGGVVYEPSAVVYHEHRREWSELRYQFYTWGKGWAAVLVKWYRRAPEHRRRIRGVARFTVRGWTADLVRGPGRTGRYRRAHCALLLAGFAAGAAGSYRRSVRRMQHRRLATAASTTPAGPAERPPAAPCD